MPLLLAFVFRITSSLYARYFWTFLFWGLPGDFWRPPFRPAWFFPFQLPLSTGGGLLCVCWKVLRIVEAHDFSTIPHVVWPVHLFFMHYADGTGGVVLLRQ